MTKEGFKNAYDNLTPLMQRIIKISFVVICILILYLIIFAIGKHILIKNAKQIMVNNGVGTSVSSLKLNVGLNPFTCWFGKINNFYLFADQVKVKNLLLIHDLEIKTRQAKITNFNNFSFENIILGRTGAEISCKLQENDFLSLISQNLQNHSSLNLGTDVYSRLGMIYINNMFDQEVCAEPYLQNNAIYLKFSSGYLSLIPPVKVVDFGMVTRNRLNVYSFEYVSGSFILKGNIV